MTDGEPALPAERVAAYLDRLGVAAPPAATLDALRELHAAHLEQVPFENLSIHLDEDIRLEADALVAKIVDRRRGGFCYELNGAFAALLRGHGFAVTLLAARVFDGDTLGPPFDHMCLRVDLDEPWLADVGFGDSFRLPLRLEVDRDQADAVGVFRLVDAGAGELDLLRDGEPQYRFDLTPRDLADYRGTCSFHETSPESHFTRDTVCSLATPDGRVTIRGDTLIQTRDGERSERTLGPVELRDTYRQRFGIDLDQLPVDPTAPATARPS
jgi:N-hydroxyarylamine O-acetyltransferase